MEKETIKETKRNNQYWVNYWINMNNKLETNHFEPQLQEMKKKLKLECDNMGLFSEQSKEEYFKLKKLIKQIDDALRDKNED